MTQSGPLAVVASLHLWFSNEDKVTDFQWFCGFSNFLSHCMHYPIWIHGCQWENYDFCLSQGSVATTSMWGGQNYRHLHRFFLMLHTKNYSNRPTFHAAIQKIKVACFYRPQRLGDNSFWIVHLPVSKHWLQSCKEFLSEHFAENHMTVTNGCKIMVP